MRAVFSDILLENSRNKLIFQRKEKNWQVMFVDMCVDDEPISDWTVVNITVVEEIHHHKPSARKIQTRLLGCMMYSSTFCPSGVCLSLLK